MEIRTGSPPRPSASARSNIAPAAGIGDDAPTATWRTPSSSRAMVKIRAAPASSSAANAAMRFARGRLAHDTALWLKESM
jgi:hypothetical protein